MSLRFESLLRLESIYTRVFPCMEYCNTLQHTATHCNTYCNTMQNTAAPVYGVLQHCATHCITLQQTATQCKTLQHPCMEYALRFESLSRLSRRTVLREIEGCALQCVAVCCSVLQCVAVCCSVMREIEGLRQCLSRGTVCIERD